MVRLTGVPSDLDRVLKGCKWFLKLARLCKGFIKYWKGPARVHFKLLGILEVYSFGAYELSN